MNKDTGTEVQRYICEHELGGKPVRRMIACIAGLKLVCTARLKKGNNVPKYIIACRIQAIYIIQQAPTNKALQFLHQDYDHSNACLLSCQGHDAEKH